MTDPTPALPANISDRMTVICDRHMAAAKALLALELPHEARQEVLALMQAFLALHNEYSRLSQTTKNLVDAVKTIGQPHA